MLVACQYQDSDISELVILRWQALFCTHRTLYLNFTALSQNVMNWMYIEFLSNFYSGFARIETVCDLFTTTYLMPDTMPCTKKACNSTDINILILQL